MTLLEAVAWVAAGAAMAAVGAAVAALRLLGGRSGASGAPPVPPEALCAGPAILLDGERVASLNVEATDRFGLAPGHPALPALHAAFPGSEGALSRLVADGRGGQARDLLATDGAGRAAILRLRPCGAQMRLTVAELLEAPAFCPLSQDAPPEPIRGLLDRAPILVWQRDAAGRVQRAEGRIPDPEGGAVEASTVAALLAASPDPAGCGEGPVRRRLEAESAPGRRLPLQAVEIAGPDGTRFGFATEAGALVAAERTLSRFVQTMTETFAHLTVGLAIFDANRRLALFNPTIVQVWGLEPAWLAERPTLREVIDALRARRRIPDFRDFHRWRDELLGLLEAPESADFEEVWTLADGTILRVLARPHPQGSLAFIFDDVTEQMALEQRNRSMDSVIRTTLDRLHEGITVFSPDGVLRYVNDAFHEIWDTDADAVALDMHIRDLVPLVRDLSHDTEVWERFATFATGEAGRRAWTSRITLASGRMLGARFAPLPDGSTMAVFADVTDSERIAAALQERNEALEAAEQMRGAVLDQISHRLRTPLNTVFGFGELLASAEAGPLNKRQQDYADGILEGAAQLLDTISEVTELASLQLDPLEGEEPGTSVEDVMTTTADLLARRAEEARVRLSLEIEGAIGVLSRADIRLRQIAFNLAADAIHRARPGATVLLNARRLEDGTVEIETREPGPAGAVAPPPELNSLTLALVRRLVAEDGGTLEVMAPVEDGGTRTLCRFPDRLAAQPRAGAAE